jgi:hypothetical protein
VLRLALGAEPGRIRRRKVSAEERRAVKLKWEGSIASNHFR